MRFFVGFLFTEFKRDKRLITITINLFTKNIVQLLDYIVWFEANKSKKFPQNELVPG